MKTATFAKGWSASFCRGLLLAVGVSLALHASPARAAWTIDWGSVIPSTIVDSNGNTIEIGDGFVFELGAFAPGFDPIESNSTDWFANWNVFDAIPGGLGGYDPTLGFFTGTAGLEAGGTSTSDATSVQAGFTGFEGLDAYLWIRNSTEMTIGSEWLLVRAQSWVFPSVPADCCDNVLPLQWSVSDLSPDDFPLWGRQDETEGPGLGSFDGPVTLQTYTIPEPTSALLLLLGALALFARRDRSGTSTRRLHPVRLASWMSALSFLCLSQIPAEAAAPIAWNSPTGQPDRDSTSAPMSGFVFELGVFNGNFVPTPANIADWEANWHPAQQTPYNPATNRFAAVFHARGNAAPFTQGKPAYVWGKKPTAGGGGEWILFRNQTWRWPNASSLGPSLVTWGVEAADTVILGTINPSSSLFPMQSVLILGFEDWAAEHLSGKSGTGPTDDPDGDGQTNLEKFVFSNSGQTRGARPNFTLGTVQNDGREFRTLRIPHGKGRLANLSVEVSSDLIHWSPDSSGVVVLEQGSDFLHVRDIEPADRHPQRFFRVRVSLP